MTRKAVVQLLGLSVLLVAWTFSNSASAVNRARFCANLTNFYTDNIANQDRLASSPILASNHWVVVERSGVTVLPGAYMQGNCTPFFDINPGSYTFFMTSAVRIASNKYIWAYHDSQEDWQWYSWTRNIAANPGGDTTINVLGAAVDEFGVSAIGTQATVIEPRMPAGTLVVHANKECEGLPGSSCVELDSTISLAPGDTQKKSIVAHEIGHWVSQGFAMGWSYNYNALGGTALCKCDHVSTSNDLHCWQSREQAGAGRNEGFAHFWAATLFNVGSHATAPYGYYKEFLQCVPSSPQCLRHPPVNFDVFTKFRWLDQNCLATEHVVEMDWAAFLYTLLNKTANAWSFAELRTTFQISDESDTTWQHVVDAAEAVHGPGHPKLEYFIETGDDYGVDN